MEFWLGITKHDFVLPQRSWLRRGRCSSLAQYLLRRRFGLGSFLSLPFLPKSVAMGDLWQLVEHCRLPFRVRQSQVGSSPWKLSLIHEASCKRQLLNLVFSLVTYCVLPRAFTRPVTVDFHDFAARFYFALSGSCDEKIANSTRDLLSINMTSCDASNANFTSPVREFWEWVRTAFLSVHDL